ncbi:MAG TPA: response regulator [Verrucomicrobiae bacterium]
MQKFDAKKQFGACLKAWRERLGFSQERLAERAELHRTYISDVERGARNLSLESITRLARALEIAPADLFPATEGEGKIALGGSRKDLVDILLVEDNEDDVDIAMHAFKQARFANRLHVAGDGQAALDYLLGNGAPAEKRPERVHLLLLDLYLPKISGMDVLRRLKMDERTRTIPVVVLTVSQVFSDFTECERLGAAAYITKPLNFQRLIQITPRLNFDWALLKAEV